MVFNAVTDRNDASALIPEEVTRDIIQSLPEASVVLNRFRRVTMSRNQYRMPVLSVLPVAYFVDGDTGLKQTTQMAWTNKYLNAEEIATIVPVPEAVLDDADYDIWGEVRPRLVEAIGMVIDAAVLFGTNKPASWPTAIVPAAAAAGNAIVRGAVNGQDLAGDISAAMALVEADGFDVNMFAARVGVKASLRDLRDDNGQLLYQQSLTAGTPNMLYGTPIQYVRNDGWDATEADMIMGDGTQAIVGIRQDITFKVLDQATLQDNTGAIIFNLAQQDMIALRVTMRLAFQVANPLTRAQSVENSRYPFSVLRPTGYV